MALIEAFWPSRRSDSSPELSALTALLESGTPPAEGAAGFFDLSTVGLPYASRQGTYWACVNKIAGDFAKCPFGVVRSSQDGRERIAHSLNIVWNRHPNSELDAFRFKETLMFDLLFYGNFFAEIEWSNDWNVLALWPLPAANTVVGRRGGEIFYRTVLLATGEVVELPASRVFHVRGPGNNPLRGVAPVRHFAKTLGLPLIQEEFAQNYFMKGTHLGLALEFPPGMSEAAKDLVKAAVREWHTGLDKAHRLLSLEEGIKVQKMGSHNQESQLVEAMGLSDARVARLLGIQPALVGIHDGTSKADAEQNSLEYVTGTFASWVVRIESSSDKQLLRGDRDDLHSKFWMTALLRGNTRARTAWYQAGVNNGWLTRNEVRENEDLAPLPGGDVLTMRLSEAAITVASAIDQQSGPDPSGGRQVVVAELVDRAGGRAGLPVVGQLLPVDGRLSERLELRAALLPVFARGAERWCRAEASAVDRALDGSLELTEFERRVGEIHADPKLREAVRREQEPLARTLLRVMAPTLRRQLGAARGTEAELEAALVAAAGDVADIHFRASRARLQAAIRGAEASALMVALRAEVRNWANRHEEIARLEVVRLESVCVQVLLSRSGRSSTWLPGEGACSWARSLAGRQFAPGLPFAAAGEEVELRDGIVKLDEPINRPPACRGCNCGLS